MPEVDREALGERLIEMVTEESDVNRHHAVVLTSDEIWTIYNALVP